MLSLRFSLFVVVAAAITAIAHAQQARDRAVELTATVSSSPARITLEWDVAPAPASGLWVYRRLAGAPTWTLLSSLPLDATSYQDNSVAPGVRFEYRVFRQTADNAIASAYGYALAGIAAPLLDQRGTVVLVIDSTHAAALASEIARWQRDLVGDGWNVVTEMVSPSDAPASVRARLQARRAADPGGLEAAILLGRVPVAYSGNLKPDGHTEHQGAWPADTFYAELDATWTDTTVMSTVATNARHHNVPGDGKFDQSILPSDADIAVGRIDMANLAGFSAGANETELLRNYLRKNHEFRHRLGAFADIPRRALIDDHFGYRIGNEPEAPASVAWRGFTPLVGRTAIAAADWFTTLQTQSYLWAYGAGAGGYTSAGGIGTSADFKTKPSRAVFNGLFGSYFGDWDSPTDPLLRALLAGTPDSLSLVSFWANRPEWVLHGLALGETIGDAYLRTVNNPGSYNDDFSRGYFNHYTDNPRGVHTTLLGDPTLRLQPVAAPASATAARHGSNVQLSWTASNETGLIGYHLYRSAAELGPYTRLTPTPITTLTFLDTAAPSTALHYQVRAVVLTATPTGTYENAGQAAFAFAPVSAPMLAPTEFVAVATSDRTITLSWNYPGTDHSGFRLERRASSTEAWVAVAHPPATARLHADGALAAGVTYFYRLFATNSLGDSPASVVALATTLAGEVLVFDSFDDDGVSNGADPKDATWITTGGTLSVVTDATLDSTAPHRVAELTLATADKDEYLSFGLPAEVTLGVGETLRLSFSLRHTAAPRADASRTGFSLAHVPGTAPWANTANREYWVNTSYGVAGTLGAIRKTVGIQLLNSATTTLASGGPSVNAGTAPLAAWLEVTRTTDSSVRVRYQLGDAAVHEALDTTEVLTTFNRIFFRFRTRTDSASPAFRVDRLTVERIAAAAPPAPEPIVAWRSQYFSAAQLSDPTLESTLWGDTADPDQDGMANLLEYALNTSPTAPDAASIALSATNTANLQLTFFRARAELDYEILASDNLSAWSVAATNPGNVGTTVTYTDPVSLTSRTTRFLRLRVSR